MTENKYKLFKFKIESALIKKGLLRQVDPQNPTIRPTPIAISRSGLAPIEWDNELWSFKHYRINLEENYVLIMHWLEEYPFSTQSKGDTAAYIVLARQSEIINDSFNVARRIFRKNTHYDWSMFEAQEVVSDLIDELNKIATVRAFKEQEYQKIKANLLSHAHSVHENAVVVDTRGSLHSADISQIAPVLSHGVTSFVILPNMEVRFINSNVRHYLEPFFDTQNQELYIRYFVGFHDTRDVILYFQKIQSTEKIFKIQFDAQGNFELSPLMQEVLTQMMVSQLCP